MVAMSNVGQKILTVSNPWQHTHIPAYCLFTTQLVDGVKLWLNKE